MFLGGGGALPWGPHTPLPPTPQEGEVPAAKCTQPPRNTNGCRLRPAVCRPGPDLRDHRGRTECIPTCRAEAEQNVGLVDMWNHTSVILSQVTSMYTNIHPWGESRNICEMFSKATTSLGVQNFDSKFHTMQTLHGIDCTWCSNMML